jgi:hypothetical protein
MRGKRKEKEEKEERKKRSFKIITSKTTSPETRIPYRRLAPHPATDRPVSNNLLK